MNALEMKAQWDMTAALKTRHDATYFSVPHRDFSVNGWYAHIFDWSSALLDDVSVHFSLCVSSLISSLMPWRLTGWRKNSPRFVNVVTEYTAWTSASVDCKGYTRLKGRRASPSWLQSCSLSDLLEQWQEWRGASCSSYRLHSGHRYLIYTHRCHQN